MVLDEVGQRSAAHKVHHNEEKRVHAVPDEADDVDVVDLGQHHNLPTERLEPLFVDESGSHALDRDESPSTLCPM